jgi:glycine hydroxymethyltransferase
MIMVTDEGLAKDPELAQKVDKAIIPGFQGGPHNHQTAAIAIALKLASEPSFKAYGAQIVKNASALADCLKKEGVSLVGNGTENHLVLVDLVKTNGAGSGLFVQEALEASGITANKNTIPGEPFSAFYPSGIRFGTPALTTRGMGEGEMQTIGVWISQIIHEVGSCTMPTDKDERSVFIKQTRNRLSNIPLFAAIKKDIAALTKRFPLP